MIRFLLIAFSLLLIATPADARRYHHRHHTPHHRTIDRLPVHAALQTDCDNSGRPCASLQRPPSGYSRHGRQITSNSPGTYAAAQQLGGGYSSLVNEARRYIGTNPTGRRSLWCGAFMDLVLKRTGHAGGGNLASAYARYGTRISGPQVGAIAVMGRRGGGHVGVVSAIDANGNPVIISGNHNHTTAESVYPRGRIYAYVMP